MLATYTKVTIYSILQTNALLVNLSLGYVILTGFAVLSHFSLVRLPVDVICMVSAPAHGVPLYLWFYGIPHGKYITFTSTNAEPISKSPVSS